MTVQDIPEKHTTIRRNRIRALRAEGKRTMEIADLCGVSPPMVSYYLKTPEPNLLRKLSEEQFQEIRDKLTEGIKGCVLANEYGVCEATISRIKKGRERQKKAPDGEKEKELQARPT